MFHPYNNKSPSSLTSLLLPQPQKQTGSQSSAVGGTPLDLILDDVIWLCFPVFRERLWNRCRGSSIKHESLQTPSRVQHSSLKRSQSVYCLRTTRVQGFGTCAWKPQIRFCKTEGSKISFHSAFFRIST